MKIVEKEINWASDTFVLTNQRVLYWPSQRALILSDLHIGKAAHFRKNGIPIPNSIHLQDLDNLDALMKHYKPTKVLIVGDLIHASSNSEVLHFANFMKQHASIEMILVKGNHDKLSADSLLTLGISHSYDTYNISNVHFCHQPHQDWKGHFQISGHIHPGVALKLPPYKSFRLPAYVVTANHIILPAFSKFTGLDTSTIFQDAKYYAFYEDGVIEV